eukprot:6760092-Prymnesium_polylepis.1
MEVSASAVRLTIASRLCAGVPTSSPQLAAQTARRRPAAAARPGEARPSEPCHPEPISVSYRAQIHGGEREC